MNRFAMHRDAFRVPEHLEPTPEQFELARRQFVIKHGRDVLCDFYDSAFAPEAMLSLHLATTDAGIVATVNRIRKDFETQWLEQIRELAKEIVESEWLDKAEESLNDEAA